MKVDEPDSLGESSGSAQVVDVPVPITSLDATTVSNMIALKGSLTDGTVLSLASQCFRRQSRPILALTSAAIKLGDMCLQRKANLFAAYRRRSSNMLSVIVKWAIQLPTSCASASIQRWRARYWVWRWTTLLCPGVIPKVERTMKHAATNKT